MSDTRIIGDLERDPAFAALLETARRDRRHRRRVVLAVAIAATFHGVLMALRIPGLERPPLVVAGKAPHRIVQLLSLPKLATPRTAIPREVEERARRIPIPDPTPLDPEPVREPQHDEPIRAPLQVADDAFAGYIPAPPSPAAQPVRAGSAISEPRRIFSVTPVYTEEARMARLQGTVILDVTLDERGGVSAVQVLRPLPHGLTEAAVAAVRQWRYEPSRLDGKPVEVLLTVTVTFNLA